MGTMCLMLASYLLGWIIAHNVVATSQKRDMALLYSSFLRSTTQKKNNLKHN